MNQPSTHFPLFTRAALASTLLPLLAGGAQAGIGAYSGYLGSRRMKTSTPVSGAQTTQVAVIDAGISNRRVLVAAAEEAGMEVILLSGEGDGVAELAAVLQGRSDIEALHLFSHGDRGQVMLGDTTLSTDVMAEHAGALAAIGDTLTDNGDLLLYGCRTAADGGLFVEELALMTGADVAASDDLTGHSEWGGDWELEITQGDIEAIRPLSPEALKDFTDVLIPASDGTYSFNADFTDSGTSLTHTHFVVTGGISSHEAYGGGTVDQHAGPLDISMYVATAVAYLAPTIPVVNELNNTVFYFDVTADGTNTGTFQLTGLTAGEYSGTDFSGLYIRGYYDGGSVTSSTVNGTGYDNNEEFTFGAAQLTAFSGVNLTHFRLFAIEADEGNNRSPADFEFRTFTIANAADPISNSAPVLGGTPADDTATEDVATAIDLSAYNISDADGDTITLTLAVDRGIIASIDGNGVTAGVTVATSGTTSMTLQGAAADLNTYLDDSSKISFTTDSNDTTTATLTVTPNDGTVDGTADTVSISITAVNDNPVITSNGGGASAATSINENTTAVTTVTETDPDVGDSHSFSISGGADAARFSINSTTGVLSFASAPNYEVPSDNGANNVYDVQVTVTDDGAGNLTDVQDIAVTVNNVNENPVITSDGGGASASVNAAENQTSVTTVTATEQDTADTLTYSLTGGADMASFSINSTSGVLSFASPPNYESPTDSGANGVYDVQVTVTDDGAGNLTDVQNLAVTVTNANENPVITSNGGGASAATSINENTTAVTTVTESDPDVGDSHSFSISGGVDAARFSINSSTGVLSFASAPNYEVPLDNGANNVYDVQVTVTDDGAGTLTDVQDIAVTVNNVNENPVITSDGGGASASVNAAENQTSVTTVTATEQDTADTLSYSLSGGADLASFSINSTSGVLSFASPPNYESPTDSGANGVYDVQVTVTDDGAGNLTDVQNLAVTVTNANDAPSVDLDASSGGIDYSTSFSAGGSAANIANSDAAIDDVDTGDNIEALTATLTVRPDGDGVESLSLNSSATAAASGAGLTVGYTASSGVLSISGSASTAVYQNVLRGIQYSNSDPVLNVTTGNRSINVVANDGGGDSTIATASVNVVTAPVVSLSAASYTEGDGASLEASSATISEPDGDNLNQLLIELTNAQDGASEVITLAGGSGVRGAVNVSYTSDTLITMSGIASAAAYQGLLQELQYSNSSDVPDTTTRTITVVGRDENGNSGATATLSLSVSAVNDAPAFAALDGAPAFTEEGAAVVLDENVTLSDAELDDVDSYDGATINLVRNGGANAVDLFSASGNLSVLTEAGSFNLGGADLGSVTSNTGGALTLTFNATATAANVDEVLQSIAYRNSSDAPDTSVQIDWTFSDGNSGDQGSGGALEDSGSTTVSITGVNDAPVNTAAPVISGTAVVGGTLNTTDGVWSDPDGDSPTYSYQWYANGVAINGATAGSYTLTLGEAHTNITVTVTADDSNGSADQSATSAALTVANTAPSNSAVPVISGTVKIGETLSTTDGSWIDVDGDSLTFSYQWKADGATITGATTNSYTLTSSEAQTVITVDVTADDANSGMTTASSAGNAVSNTAPTISGAPATGVGDDVPYSFTPSASDSDGDTLSFSISNKPSWASFSTSTGALTGTPSNSDVGSTSNIVISVSDGSLSASLASFNLEVYADLDNDNIADSSDTDDDGDGMPDSWESANGLDPRDASDAASDKDGDGVSNLDEYTASSDPSVDDYPPSLSAPPTVTVDAEGLFTAVNLGTPVANDALDGELSAISDAPSHFTPGVHSVTWTATDAAGNSTSATQTVNVIPLVSFSKDQTSAEGATARFSVILNGAAVNYPVSVPYSVSGTSANDGSDHSLVDGVASIASGTEVTVNFTIVDDGAGEGSETILVTMGSPTNAVTGPKSSHRISVLEGNVAPTISLSADQGGGATRTVTQVGGAVTITSALVDPNPGDSHSYDWSGSDNALVDTDSAGETFTFDPSGLIAGLYRLRLIVSDGAASDTAELTLNVLSATPTLTTADSDGDGADDASEGYGDDDSDGVPDYLDAIDSANVLQEQSGDSSSFLIETEPGLGLSLGDVAFQSGGGGAEVEMTDVTNGSGVGGDDNGYEYNGGLFDFVIEDLPVAGQSVQVVVPQVVTIPADAVYRKLMPGGWQDFVVDANNAVASAMGEEGYCPPPGDDAYASGLSEGHWCVQLTLEDGGPNDADGSANNSVDDPSGVAKPMSADVNVNVSSSGAGSWHSLWLLLLGLLALSRQQAARKGGKQG